MFSILIDANGDVQAAGFCDFSAQATGGLRQIAEVGHAIPTDVRRMRWDGKSLVPCATAPPPVPPSLPEQVAALWAWAQQGGLKPDATAADGTPEKVLAALHAAKPAPPGKV